MVNLVHPFIPVAALGRSLFISNTFCWFETLLYSLRKIEVTQQKTSASATSECHALLANRPMPANKANILANTNVQPIH